MTEEEDGERGADQEDEGRKAKVARAPLYQKTRQVQATQGSSEF